MQVWSRRAMAWGLPRPLPELPPLLPTLRHMQDKGKRPAVKDDRDYSSSEEEEEEEEEDGGPYGSPGAPDSAAGGAEGATEAAAGGAGQPGLAAEDSEPGDLTCAICLNSIPLENLAMVKVRSVAAGGCAVPQLGAAAKPARVDAAGAATAASCLLLRGDSYPATAAPAAALNCSLPCSLACRAATTCTAPHASCTGRCTSPSRGARSASSPLTCCSRTAPWTASCRWAGSAGSSSGMYCLFPCRPFLKLPLSILTLTTVFEAPTIHSDSNDCF